MITNLDDTPKSKFFKEELEFSMQEFIYHANALEESLNDLNFHLKRANFYLNQIKDYNKKLNEGVL